MAYSTTDQVASEFKSIDFGAASSVVVTAEVTRFIEEADAEIDSQIGQKYVVPIDSTNHPESFKIVRMLSIWLVADRVRQIMEMKNIAPEAIEQGVRVPNSAKMAREMIKKIVQGKMTLSDAELVSAANGVRSFSVDNSEEHTFQKNVDQW